MAGLALPPPVSEEKERKRSSYRRRKRHVPYLRFVRTQPGCAAAEFGDPFSGPIEAAHSDHEKALSQKTVDTRALNLCRKHHRKPGLAFVSRWVAMSKPERRDWWYARADKLRARYLARFSEAGDGRAAA
jgi:hypothetical protein